MCCRKSVGIWVYSVFVFLSVYWLINMSFKSNVEILDTFSLWPQPLTWIHCWVIFTDPSWYNGYFNSIYYVVLNSIITLLVAPPAVFLPTFFQFYSSVGFDTHIAVALAHCLFSVPLAVWVLEGFMSSVPREIDKTAFIDDNSLPRFFIRIFLPLMSSGIGVTVFFSFMFCGVERLLFRALSSIEEKPFARPMIRTIGASGVDWGVLAVTEVLTIIPGILVSTLSVIMR